MTTSIDYIRQATDSALYAPVVVGTRRFQVFLVVNTWDGDRPGLGNKTQTITPIYNQLGALDGYVRCRQVEVKDVVLSQGLLKDIQWIIGPIVLPYSTGTATGGYDINTFQGNAKNTQSYILINGQGLPTAGQVCKKVFDETDRSVAFKLYCQNVGSQSY